MAPKKSSTEFRWTDDELELLPECCADFESQKEYQGINWEDTRNKYEKIKEIFIDRYPTEEADIERFPNETKVEEIVTKERIWQKSKLFAQILGREWTVVIRVVVGVLFLHFIANAKVYG